MNVALRSRRVRHFAHVFAALGPLCGFAGALTAEASAQSAAASPAPPLAPVAEEQAWDGTLRFEKNIGQLDAAVRYIARGRSYALRLTSAGATLTLNRRTASGDQQATVRMSLIGARSVEPQGRRLLGGKSNYFVGDDRSAWRSGVPSYGSVRYESVLPGIDIEYHGARGRELEYDFTVAPGAIARAIELRFEGISRIELTNDGCAMLVLNDGSQLVKERPIAYQERDGRRMPVAARYELRAGGLGFALGAHDASLPLVIDPILTYSSYFGGSSFDEATGIAADAGGNTYIVGYTSSTLFPTSSAEQPAQAGGVYDAFIVKLDPTGKNLVYSTYLGGSGADIAYGVATDALGNAYVAGLTSSTNFPLAAPFQATPGGSQDAFVTKLNATGSALVYSTYIGGALDDYAKGIAVSNTGAAYLIGTTFSANFPKAAPLQASRNGDYDAFALQLAPAGTSLVYSTYLGGSGSEFGNGIALDSVGNAYLVGSTTSSNFPTLNARQNAHAGGNTDAFVSKLTPTGSGFVYSTYLGGSSADEALGVSVTLNTAFVVGDTFSSNFPLGFPAQPAPGGNNHSDAFITRFDPSGTAFVYSTYLGGTGNETATAVASDGFGNAYVVGSTDSADLPLQSPLDGQSAYHGGGDAFLATLTPPGSRFAYTSYLGGAGQDAAAGITWGAHTTYILGNTRSSDFPVVSPLLGNFVGSQDAFIAKLPSIDSVAAPAARWPWLLAMAGALLGIASFFLSGHRPSRARYRTGH